MKLAYTAAGASALLSLSLSAASGEVQACTEIAALPTVITQQGIYCLKKDLSMSATSGSAIAINTNNVTIEMNGYKLGGLAAGNNTQAYGIHADGRQNITIRNGTVRGFLQNIRLVGNGGGHLVEGIRSEAGRETGISVYGSNSTVRDNMVFSTGNGLYAGAWAIVASYGASITVIGNTIGGVTETDTAYGIAVFSTDGAVVQGNRISGLQAATMRGISATGSGAVIRDNIVSNAVTGSTGIMGGSTLDGCLNNVVRNFTTAISGCEHLSGNQAF